MNKGKRVGRKAPPKPADIRDTRVHLQDAHHVRDPAMFNLAIGSELAGANFGQCQPGR